MVADAVDVLQIPAFLCRQTDLVVAAAATGKPVNIKKAQFLAPWDMGAVVEKAASTGNRSLILTERGSSFGYNNLVVDFKGIGVMAQLGYPVVLDVTHSLQLPAGEGGRTGGQPEFAELLARAGVAAGVDALFIEVHDRPREALSDASTQMELERLGPLLERIVRIREAIRE
jgi:2-dehydro-3-deoxyphosphooctonate aldolase (KDO 8-P synthase)